MVQPRKKKPRMIITIISDRVKEQTLRILNKIVKS